MSALPPFVNALLARVEETAVSTAIRETTWLFPVVETVHVLALTLVVGTIATFDLRLIGWASRQLPVTRLARELLPWTWGGFVAAVVSGALLFGSKAIHYAENPAFQLKVVLLILSGVNMLVFQTVTFRRVAEWDTALPPPARARTAGALSLIFWIGVVAAGRWIGFLL